MNSNIRFLNIGVVAFFAMAMTFIAIFNVIPSAAEAGQKIAQAGPDFSQLSLSSTQRVQFTKIETDIKSKILPILSRNQQTLLNTKLAQGQTIWQVFPTLKLSQDQRSKAQSVMRSQMPKIFSILTPQQQLQLMRNMPARPHS